MTSLMIFCAGMALGIGIGIAAAILWTLVAGDKE